MDENVERKMRRRRREREMVVAIVGGGGGFLEEFLVNWWVSGRGFVCILRKLEGCFVKKGGSREWGVRELGLGWDGTAFTWV